MAVHDTVGVNVVVELMERFEGGASELIPDIAAVENVVAFTLRGDPVPTPFVATTCKDYAVDWVSPVTVYYGSVVVNVCPSTVIE